MRPRTGLTVWTVLLRQTVCRLGTVYNSYGPMYKELLGIGSWAGHLVTGPALSRDSGRLLFVSWIRLIAMTCLRHESRKRMHIYFQPKVRLCRDLSLPFLEVRDHVLKGLYSREMELYPLGCTHLIEKDLLGDLLEWARMDAIHSFETKSNESKPTTKKNDFKVSKPGVYAWTRFKPVEEKTTEGVSIGNTSSFWFARKHQSSDCLSKRKNTCYGCGVEGHIRPNCPGRDQSSVVVLGRAVASHTYHCIARINSREVDVLLDTGCHHMTARVAVSYGISLKTVEKPLYRLGSTTVPSVQTVGMIRASVAVELVVS